MNAKAIGRKLNTLALTDPLEAGKRIFNLFRSPVRRAIVGAEQAFLATAEERDTLRIATHDIATYRWGKAKPSVDVLLLHGWESNSARWRWLMPHLREAGYTVAAIDAPAHGNSSGAAFDIPRYGEAVATAIAHFMPRAVVGHSMGGVCLSYALTHHTLPVPERIVIMGTPSDLRFMIEGFARVLGLQEVALRGLDAYFEQVMERTIDYFSVAAFSERIEVPTLVLHDEGDPTAPVGDARRYARALPNGRLHITHGLGHSLQGNDAYRAILDFLSA